MIYGETGTGKSFVSRMLHDLSGRAAGRFVDVNCAAIPPTLIESELFGHTRGAFTGASADKMGLVEAAHRGTLFLDEISELDLTVQAKLLTLLDSLRLRRVGGVENIAVDLRLVAATNRMLLTEVAQRRFREDLFYRLQLVFIHIPPLRDRGDDVQLLADHYLAAFAASYRTAPKTLDPRVREVFARYRWPGNVRELAHLVERFYILSDAPRVMPEDLPQRMTDPGFWSALGLDPDGNLPALASEGGEGGPAGLEDATRAFQRRFIAAALRECDGNLARAAARLGVSRHALRYRLMALGMARQPG
jgi:DNA-binding NtrC family response regulator